MSLGVLLAFASVVMTSLTNVVQEYIADRYPAGRSLLVQYIFLVAVAAVFLFFFDTFALRSATPQFIGMLLGTGLIGYLGIWLLFRGLSRLNVGVVMMIAFSYVFFSYLLNLALFPAVELLSREKVGVAVLFFGVICLLLFHRDQQSQRIELDVNMLYPLGTAVCRSIFFAANNYFIKEGFLSPFQTVFYTEGTILLVAAVQFLRARGTITSLIALPRGVVGMYLLRGLCNFSMGLLTYYAYQYAPANLVNIIKLFSIITTAIFGWWLLKEVLTKRELVLMVVATVLLIFFVTI